MPLSDDAKARMRRAVGEPDGSNGYTDLLLDNIFGQNALDFDATAADVWRDKAAKAAHLVDVTEGPSSRKMSQLQKQALGMVKLYGGDAATDDGGGIRARTRPIERV